ncbi:hypothetical protein NOW01_08960, partial [Anoxybacillus salavatliensis]|uniref:hypothetical protein n=1 Tax=Anoxybacillus gonensis TaxID=198467 RepID=UPI00214B6983
PSNDGFVILTFLFVVVNLFLLSSVVFLSLTTFTNLTYVLFCCQQYFLKKCSRLFIDHIMLFLA